MFEVLTVIYFAEVQIFLSYDCTSIFKGNSFNSCLLMMSKNIFVKFLKKADTLRVLGLQKYRYGRELLVKDIKIMAD